MPLFWEFFFKNAFSQPSKSGFQPCSSSVKCEFAQKKCATKIRFALEIKVKIIFFVVKVRCVFMIWWKGGAGRGVAPRPQPQTGRDRVALGDFSPRAPTEPYVRTLAHTAHHNFASLRVFVHFIFLWKCSGQSLEWAMNTVQEDN